MVDIEGLVIARIIKSYWGPPVNLLGAWAPDITLGYYGASHYNFVKMGGRGEAIGGARPP